jgi:hypothetical protein
MFKPGTKCGGLFKVVLCSSIIDSHYPACCLVLNRCLESFLIDQPEQSFKSILEADPAIEQPHEGKRRLSWIEALMIPTMDAKIAA